MLISGKKQALDVDDLRRNTRFSGCSYADEHIVMLWKALSAMTDDNRAKFLKLCTSCSRPPVRGCKDLVPPFTVQLIEIAADGDKLPSAQTCFNSLRLPTYSSWEVMKAKLEYAINSNAGFELS